MTTPGNVVPFTSALPRVLRRKQLECELRRARQETVVALAHLLALKEVKRRPHPDSLAHLAETVGEHLGLSARALEDLRYALLPHDIGKLAVPDAILLKPGPLTERERRAVRRHPELGSAILRQIPGFDRVSVYVLHHHERMDGGGYPAGLCGDEIPLGARILSVVDAFEAMLSTRSYRPSLQLEEALERLRRAAGTRFDPAVVELFAELATRLPPEMVDAGQRTA